MFKRRKFKEVVGDILAHEEFQKLKNEPHHFFTSRYNHSVRVAWLMGFLTKYTSPHYEDYVRATLLHDFFFNHEMPEKVGVRQAFAHPKVASKRAQELFNINKRQIRMIESHMLPFTKAAPLGYGCILLILTDKIVAVYELIIFGVLRTIKTTALGTKKVVAGGAKRAHGATKKIAKRVKNSGNAKDGEKDNKDNKARKEHGRS